MTDPDQISTATIQTFLGQRFNVFDPDPRKIHHKDIAHALSMLCRYGGHSSRFYSVAEHSVLMAIHFEALGRQDLARVALMHDATEAYMGDLVRPIKLAMPTYQAAETLLQHRLFIKYGLDPLIPLEVKEADVRICNDERDELMHSMPWPGVDELGPLGVDLQFWNPQQAERSWLNAFFRYGFWSETPGS